MNIIAVSGVTSAGKTSSIKLAFDLLRRQYPEASIDTEYSYFGKVDIRVILVVNGMRIGIESQGDPSGRIYRSLKLFVELRCDVILCATRSEGDTVEAVQKLSGSVQWINKARTPGNHLRANKETARRIVELVQALVDSPTRRRAPRHAGNARSAGLLTL